MVKRVNNEGFRWLEPPYTPDEQQILGGAPPYPTHVTAESYSVSACAADERYDILMEFDMTFYFRDGDLLNVTVNGKVLGLEAAQIIIDAMSGGGNREEWTLVDENTAG